MTDEYIFKKVGKVPIDRVLHYFQQRGWVISEEPRYHRFNAQLFDPNGEELNGIFIPNDPMKPGFDLNMYATLDSIARLEKVTFLEVLERFVPTQPPVQVNVTVVHVSSSTHLPAEYWQHATTTAQVKPSR